MSRATVGQVRTMATLPPDFVLLALVCVMVRGRV